MAGDVARVESFISGATLEQVALLGASCAERSSGILFWIVSSEGREGDLEIYRRSLDYLWGRVRSNSIPPPVRSSQIEQIRELSIGDEATLGAAFALHSALSIQITLKFYEESNKDLIKECVAAARDQVYFLERRTGAEVLKDEEESLDDDISLILKGITLSVIDQIRGNARRVGRRRLDVAIARYGTKGNGLGLGR